MREPCVRQTRGAGETACCAVVVAQGSGRRVGSCGAEMACCESGCGGAGGGAAGRQLGAVAAFSSDRSAPNAHPLCSERSGPRWIAVIKAMILSTIAPSRPAPSRPPRGRRAALAREVAPLFVLAGRVLRVAYHTPFTESDPEASPRRGVGPPCAVACPNIRPSRNISKVLTPRVPVEIEPCVLASESQRVTSTHVHTNTGSLTAGLPLFFWRERASVRGERHCARC